MARVLVVDDSDFVRMLAREAFESDGHEVVEAPSGHEGLARLQEGGFDILLTDIEMPDGDGYELVAAVRADARFASLPIVVCSNALEREEARARMVALGADQAVQKPADPAELVSVTMAALAQRRSA